MKLSKWIMVTSAAMLTSVSTTSAFANSGYTQTNLVSDLPGAIVTDANLVNPWGMASSATSPFWVSGNGAGVVTVYSVDPTTNVPSKVAFVVSIPGSGSVTGQVYSNVAGNFNGDLFLFVSEDGTVSGWRNALGTTAETLVLANASNVYKGAASATIGLNSYLYAANFRAGTIDVFKGNAAAPSLTGSFTDPNLPSGYAPFNIQNIGGKLYVTYAQQDVAQHDDVPGAGHGFVNTFDLNGNVLGRLITQGSLNSPWGLAMAPNNFGDFSGALLVGNFGDGTINAFNAANGAHLGTLSNSGGTPIVVPGLWGLRFGSGGGTGGGMANALYFTAGIPGTGAIEDHGLFGSFTLSPPGLVGAVSRKVHASAGTFDLPLVP